MTAAIAPLTTSLKRRAAMIAVLVGVATAVFCTGTSARQTIAHTSRRPGGTIVVSGYDGGVAIAPSQTP